VGGGGGKEGMVVVVSAGCKLGEARPVVLPLVPEQGDEGLSVDDGGIGDAS
jgi:hypothetical protein